MCFNDGSANLLVLTMSAFCSYGHLEELQMAEKYPIKWSLWTGFTVVHRQGISSNGIINVG